MSFMHALAVTGLVILTPVILWLALWLFAEDRPRQDDPPDTGGKEDGSPAPVAA